MNSEVLFRGDHHGFYRKELPFFPMIQEDSRNLMEWSNTVMVKLPARLQDDLEWSNQLELAQQCVALGKYILWEIDLGLDRYQFDPQDSAAFYSFTLALEEFSSKVWPQFCAHTFGLVLYRGKFDPLSSFSLAKWESAYLDWLEGKCDSEDEYAVYCAQNFAEYLQRLISFLPDTTLPFVMLDVLEIHSSAKIAQLFSYERFGHTHLILKGAPYFFSGITWDTGHIAQGWMGSFPQDLSLKKQVTTGIYLPKDQMINSSVLAQIDALINSFHQSSTSFRIVSEEKLTELWDGLDRIVVPSQAISAQGKRKLLGFIAAGGVVASVGDPLGLPEEVSIVF
jgi:hypothetical protein